MIQNTANNTTLKNTYYCPQWNGEGSLAFIYLVCFL